VAAQNRQSVYFPPNKLSSQESPKNYNQMHMGESVFFRPHFFQNTGDISFVQEILSATRHPIYALKEDADFRKDRSI
jgi:hypothetical protein